MTRRLFRSVAGIACVLTIAAAGVALQPAGGGGGRPGAQPQGQPEGQPGRQPGERGPGGRGQQPASVEGSMRGMNRALRQLSSQIEDGTKKDENLRLVNDMQRGVVNAKGAPLPEKYVKDAKDDAAKAKIGDEFRRELIKALRTLLDIETDITDGKYEAAKAKLQQLTKLRDHAHEELGVHDE